MDLIKTTLFPLFRNRPFFSCAFVAPLVLALALALPLFAQSGGETVINASNPDASKVPASMQEAVTVMVEMNGAPASATYAVAYQAAQAQADAARNYALAHPKLKSSVALLKQPALHAQISSTSASQVKSMVQRLDQAQTAIVPALTSGDIAGKVIFRSQRAYNGIAMIVSADKIAQIAALPGVKAVHPMHPKFLDNTFSDIDFLNVRAAWTKMPFGTHGENIKVADIDTGLDYIHVNFGGSGSAADYASTSDTGPVPNANFPTPKVPGGIDLAGDAYAATASGLEPSNIPHPDNNPLDCGGHGTGTASLIGGYGETNAGFTYAGSYDAANPDITTLKIPPGMAPNAKLYPVRVFGCSGSTNLVTQAIEWSMDPNGDGDFSDRMDVINMSLGSNEGYADDADDVAASNAAAIGIQVCSAAGNAGDSYYIHSSPAAASGTLGIAASYNNQNGYIFDSTLTVNAPPADAGQQDFTIYTTTSPHTSVTGDIVYANPHDGSAPLTNASFCAGKIVVVDRVPGQGANASVNAQNAGAIGIIDIADLSGANGNPFLLSTSPALTKPMVVCSMAFGNNLKTEAAFDANGVSTTGVNVTIAPGNGSVVQPANPPGSPAVAGSADTIPSYSSRGPRLPDSAIKPDVTAPAEVVAVAVNAAGPGHPINSFSGNSVANFNGTSSATPHIAGVMALLRQLHSTWSVQELNALACNTATHDLFTTSPGASPSPTPSVQLGVGRIGAGRIDVANASNANVVAYNGTDSGLLGVSFGVVETPVDGSSNLTKNITVTNKGATNVTYNTSIQSNPAVAGTAFSLGSVSFTVNAGTTMTIPVTFSATGNLLKHAREASVAATQAGNPRQWLTEAGGYAVFTPTDSSPVLRVELYAAPKPVSSMHATVTGVVPTAPNTGSFNINLSGAPVNTGASLGTGFDIVSLVKAFELQYASPDANAPAAPADKHVIKYVGITSDYVTRTPATTRIVWGLDLFGDTAEPDFDGLDREIFIDTGDGAGGPPDGTFDFVVFPADLGAAAAGDENVYLPEIVKFHSNSAVLSAFFTNGLNSAVADTNAYNNSAITMPVAASTFADTGYPALGSAGHTFFQYQVVTFDRNGNEVDETPVLSYDLAKPGMEVENSGSVAGVQVVFSSATANVENFMYKDLPTNFVPVNYNGTNFQANGSLGVLLMHMHNGDGNRSDVVAFRKPTVSGFSPTSGKVGAQITITGSNFGPGTVVKFFNNKPAVVNVLTANTLVATVPAGAVTGPIRVSNAAGSTTAPGNFTVLP
jgi:hypothetical protein